MKWAIAFQANSPAQATAQDTALVGCLGAELALDVVRILAIDVD